MATPGPCDRPTDDGRRPDVRDRLGGLDHDPAARTTHRPHGAIWSSVGRGVCLLARHGAHHRLDPPPVPNRHLPGPRWRAPAAVVRSCWVSACSGWRSVPEFPGVRPREPVRRRLVARFLQPFVDAVPLAVLATPPPGGRGGDHAISSRRPDRPPPDPVVRHSRRPRSNLAPRDPHRAGDAKRERCRVRGTERTIFVMVSYAASSRCRSRSGSPSRATASTRSTGSSAAAVVGVVTGCCSPSPPAAVLGLQAVLGDVTGARPGRGRLHAPRRRPLPAAAAPRPGRGRPPLRPRPLRRRANADRLRRAPPRRGRLDHLRAALAGPRQRGASTRRRGRVAPAGAGDDEVTAAAKALVGVQFALGCAVAASRRQPPALGKAGGISLIILLAAYVPYAGVGSILVARRPRN